MSEINTSINGEQTSDYIVLEEEYHQAGRMYGLIKSGGSINIGNYAIYFKTNENNITRVELRYIPKGNYHKPETLYVPKKKVITDSIKSDEVEL
jgi:hypothetical protein